jgi:gamma-glutamyl-gamma-aminobutyrate hydrolase PuuD
MVHVQRPFIGIGADLARDEQARPRHQVRATYVDAVVRAGGIPVILPASADARCAALDRLDGVVIVGGDDIDVRPFGVPLHPMARVMDPERQSAVLGICLGMQLMGVHRGATLIQHLDDRIPDAARHRDDRVHAVETAIGRGPVASWHHQALADAPGFAEIGRADDGVLEAIRDDGRPFYLGVQWHPERTADPTLGDGVFRLLVQAARGR